MFDSGITASDLIDELKSEIDVAIPISNESYVESLNSLEQLLYTEIIKEQREAEVSSTDPFFFANTFDLSEIDVETDEKSVVFEDVYALYDTDGVQYKKTNPATCRFMGKTWCKENENTVTVNPGGSISLAAVDIIYFVRPALKTVNSSTHEVESGNVMLPVEFIDLAKAKLRADAYKIANEDAFAAKWMNDYNVLLETFKVWVESKRSHFGL